MIEWLLIPVAALMIGGLYFFAAISGERQLRDWCEKKGYKVKRLEQRLVRQGPFHSWLSVRQVVFFVLITDSSGLHLKGFARCGHWLWGTLFGEVEFVLCAPQNETRDRGNQSPPATT